MSVVDKVKILVVDDLPEKVLVLRSVLADLGEEIIVACSGAEALQAVLQHDFAVILLDINMPDMDGYETAELIRKRRRSAHVPIIFITGYHDQVHEAQGYSLGAVDYILSPVVPDILRTKVKVFADLFRMTAEAKRHAEERVVMAREQAARESAERHTAALRASEERFRLAAEAVAGFIYEVDLVTSKGTASRGVTELTGFTVAEAGDLAWWASRVHPDDLAVTQNHLAAAEKSDKRNYRFEYRMRHRDGHYLHVWDQGLIVRNAAGQPVRRVGNVVDITERKRAEEALAEASRRKDEFLSMLAHELRNPLAPIRNAVQIMRLKNPTDPQLCMARDIIDRNVTQMTRLVDDLLDVSRITQGKIRLDRRPFELVQAIAQAVEICTPLVESRTHRLHVSLPDDPIIIDGDATRLTQVFANLLTNAAKYSDNGSDIWLTTTTDGGHVLIEVRDAGIGLPVDMLEAVFDPFTQVGESLNRAQGGLGIGLTLVRRLVDLHDGTVRASSNGPGTGCTFTVRLPRVIEPNTAPQDDRSRRSTGACQAKRVLIVDDNIDAAESLGLLVELTGHAVRVVHSGPTALTIAQEFQPSIIVLDIGLPDMDGYEIARRLRSNPHFTDVMLVALTGYGQAEDRRRSREVGFDHHLVKPVDPEKFQQLLANHIRRRPARST